MRKAALVGVSLVEILIALAIFSTAIVGLYMAMNGMNQAIATTMKRDIESAYANTVLSKISPADVSIETAYDAKTPPNTPSCSGNTIRCSVTLPTGDKFYYTVEVQSTATAADVKLIDMYLFHDATSTTPYRQFHRQLILNRWGCMIRASSGSYYRDSIGQLYSQSCSMNNNWSSTAKSYKAGKDSAVTGAGVVGSTASDYANPTNTPDPSLFNEGGTVAPAGPIGWVYPASANHTYTITLGFNEIKNTITGANQRLFEVWINNIKVDTIDIWAQAGGNNKPMVRFYTAQPILDASGVYVLKLKFVPIAPAASVSPMINYIDITRS